MRTNLHASRADKRKTVGIQSELRWWRYSGSVDNSAKAKKVDDGAAARSGTEECLSAS